MSRLIKFVQTHIILPTLEEVPSLKDHLYILVPSWYSFMRRTHYLSSYIEPLIYWY